MTMLMKNSKIICAIIAAALLGAVFYFVYFMKTPAYAVDRTIEAIRQHNSQEFSRYVDVQSVMNSAFDDSLKAESKINNDNILSNPFAVGILHMLKPSVVDLMNQEALRLVENKKEDKEKVVDPVPDAMMRNMERRVSLKELSLGKFNIEQAGDETAVLTAAVHNKKLTKDFLLQFELTKQDDGYWKITRIKNLAELIIQLDAAKRAQLAAQNKPVMEKLNQSLQVLDKKLGITSALVNDIREYRLNAVINVRNKTTQTIKRIYYDVTIMDKDGKSIYSYPEHFNGTIAPGAEVHLNTSKLLNGLLPDDKKLMAMDVFHLPSRIQVTYIAFNDGSILEPRTYFEQ